MRYAYIVLLRAAPAPYATRVTPCLRAMPCRFHYFLHAVTPLFSPARFYDDMMLMLTISCCRRHYAVADGYVDAAITPLLPPSMSPPLMAVFITPC